MKNILLPVVLLLSVQAVSAGSVCRDLNSSEKPELKKKACEAIAKLHERSFKVDINRCQVKAVFNLCEITDNGFTDLNLEVDGVTNNFGQPFVCTMDVSSRGEIDSPDCNANY